jgi:hypothetical protein
VLTLAGSRSTLNFSVVVPDDGLSTLASLTVRSGFTVGSMMVAVLEESLPNNALVAALRLR